MRAARLSAITRFIPACAGNGLPPRGRAAATTVHPRVRGERPCCLDRCSGVFGSSPRARGTDSPAIARGQELRFIPACAGNGSCADTPRSGRPVHPRVRGERGTTGRAPRARTGSSPRARGTGEHLRRGGAGLRFIPACAGNGSSGCDAGFQDPVHPRVRGERLAAMRSTVTLPGSSPRARGTGRQKGPEPLGSRFIPACAGNGCTG